VARPLAVGDRVRVRRSAKTARIAAFLRDIEGGVRLVTPILGCIYWNVADLRRVPGRPSRKPVKFTRAHGELR
jgi:hypothetical protein